MYNKIKQWTNSKLEGGCEEKDYLWLCAKYNKVRYIKYLSDKNWYNQSDYDFALIIACGNGCVKAVKALLNIRLYSKDVISYVLEHKIKSNNNKIINLLKN